MPRRKLSVHNSRHTSSQSLLLPVNANTEVDANVVESARRGQGPVGSSRVYTREAAVYLPSATNVLRDRLSGHERAQMVDGLNRRSSIRPRMSIRQRSTRRDTGTFHNDEVFELDATETEIKRVTPIGAVIPSSLAPGLGPLTPIREEDQPRLSAEQTSHDDEPIFENWGDTTPADGRHHLGDPIPSLLDRQEKLNAALDGAPEKNATSSKPLGGMPSSQTYPPLTEKRSQTVQTKRDQVWPRHSYQRKGRALQHRPASLKRICENGWIPADEHTNFKPEELDIEALKLETAGGMLQPSEKSPESSGAPRIRGNGANAGSLANKASRIPLGPIARPVMIVDTAARSSMPIQETKALKAEAPRILPLRAEPLSSVQKSRLPVPCKKAIMLGRISSL
jgi:hypothetical protein